VVVRWAARRATHRLSPVATALSPEGVKTKADARAALAWLKKRSTKKTRDGLARFGIPAEKALGVPMNQIHVLAKQLGRDHELAAALWASDVYEARLLAAFVEEPAKVTAAQMNRWCRDFDNWAVVDTICFKLFDQTPHAFAKVEEWVEHTGEFQKRAGFVLMACVAAHNETATDAHFRRWLPLVERGASDERNFVKKGVSWALRMLGRQSAALHAESVKLAQRLAASATPAAKWVGRDALRDLTKPAVSKRFKATK
jgi:3-methyladenine DNA glycosylase AlkD